MPIDLTQPSSSLLEKRRVPNILPKLKCFPYKIAIVGEAPGKDEHVLGLPFVGMSGKLLDQLLAKAAIVRDALFIGNICQFRPPDNDLSSFNREGEEIKDGLAQLEKDFGSFSPNVVLLLGNTALSFAKDNVKVSDWRGSVFISNKPGPFFGRKCIASYHPAAVLRQYNWKALLMLDIQKAKKHSLSPEFTPIERQLLSALSFEELLKELDSILEQDLEISPDIEGGLGSMTCCSLATSPAKSILVPFANMNGTNFWESEEEEYQVWDRFIRIMARPSIKKCWQNGLYDRFVKQYGYSLMVYGNQDDTMLKFWEQYCELEKSLGFQCSILTDEQYYKSERKSTDRAVHFLYCCKDSANTFDINKKLDSILKPDQVEHYRRNHDLLNPLLYMELKGIRYDEKEAARRLEEVKESIYFLQYELDRLVGVGINPNTNFQSIIATAKDSLCTKRDQNRPKKGNEEAFQWIKERLSESDSTFKVLTNTELGKLNTLLNLSLNIKSKTYKTYLYETLNLPKQYEGEGDSRHVSSNYLSLLRLQKKATTETQSSAVRLGIEIGLLRTRAQMLEIRADGDGRVRCGYNIVGTKTGRLSCYTSPIGSGYNLQTIPDTNSIREKSDPLHSGMRDLFLADEGYYFFQCDLKGSDGWTIGAILKSLGDSTMIDDLSFGIKPASRVCYTLRYLLGQVKESLEGKPRDVVKELLKCVRKEDWDYFASKIGIWGICYTMGPDLLANQILEESEGKIQMSRREVEIFRQAVMKTYRVKLYHDYTTRLLAKKPVLTAPNGFTRRFFGRPTEILGQALAHLPQVITTYATNSAMFKLWTDSENRIYDGKLHRSGVLPMETMLQRPKPTCQLRIQPLHQVHDALCGQFKIEDTSWAISKIKSYFNNPIVISGQTITIPFEGAYGTNWALDEKSKVGSI